jgi:hypothetical protein
MAMKISGIVFGIALVLMTASVAENGSIESVPKDSEDNRIVWAENKLIFITDIQIRGE